MMFDRRWLTSNVIELAMQIYRDYCGPATWLTEKTASPFERLPILADALMDAGCDNQRMIDQLQSHQPRALIPIFYGQMMQGDEVDAQFFQMGLWDQIHRWLDQDEKNHAIRAMEAEWLIATGQILCGQATEWLIAANKYPLLDEVHIEPYNLVAGGWYSPSLLPRIPEQTPFVLPIDTEDYFARSSGLWAYRNNDDRNDHEYRFRLYWVGCGIARRHELVNKYAPRQTFDAVKQIWLDLYSGK